MAQQGINVLALLKNGERYVFLYDDRSSDQLLQTLGRYAADPELNFSWYDAAVLSQRIRSLQNSGAEVGGLNMDDLDVSPTAGSDDVPRNRIQRRAA